MNFTRAYIPDLVICEPTIFKDKRGFFFESFRKNSLEKYLGFSLNFCQENISESKFGVLRGLHFQIGDSAQSKLVSVTQGNVLDIVVDIRSKSKFFGKSLSIELSDANNKQLFIPSGFAHGFIVLSEKARISYKVDNYYNPTLERGFNYDDPKLNLNWRIDKKNIIINEKDCNYPNFESVNYF